MDVWVSFNDYHKESMGDKKTEVEVGGRSPKRPWTKCLGISADTTGVFTIFCVEPFVSM